MADTVLVWLAEERAGVREVAPQSHPIIRELRAQVESPISVLIPLMDLTDQLFIDADIFMAWRSRSDPECLCPLLQFEDLGGSGDRRCASRYRMDSMDIW
ncbi:MAG: DUF2066 domain-containing protein [Nitrincola sp.]|nr:DUF2066 domain-containing protein [Nitrincola sp.]